MQAIESLPATAGPAAGVPEPEAPRSPTEALPDEPTEERSVSDARVPLHEVVTAVIGLLAFGATVAVGTGGGSASAGTSPSVALGAVGALVLTAPAVVVCHQYLRIDTPVSAVVDRIAAGLSAGGRLAWGVVPAALFFAATAPGSWPAVIALLGVAVASVLLGSAAWGLDGLAPSRWTWRAAVVAWVLVTVAIGARLVTTLSTGG
jgi:hypothetical protein